MSNIIPMGQGDGEFSFGSEAEWLEACEHVGTLTSWVVGDMWLWAQEHEYGDSTRRKGAEMLGESLGSLDHKARTSAAFPRGVRSAELPFSVHKALAAVPDPALAIRIAVDERWTAKDAAEFARAETIAQLPTKPADDRSDNRHAPRGALPVEAPTPEPQPEPEPAALFPEPTPAPEPVPAEDVEVLDPEPVTPVPAPVVDDTRLQDLEAELAELRRVDAERAAREAELAHENRALRDTLESLPEPAAEAPASDGNAAALTAALAELADAKAAIDTLKSAVAKAQITATAPPSRRIPPPLTTARAVTEFQIPECKDKAIADRLSAEMVALMPKMAVAVARKLGLDDDRVIVLT